MFHVGNESRASAVEGGYHSRVLVFVQFDRATARADLERFPALHIGPAHLERARELCHQPEGAEGILLRELSSYAAHVTVKGIGMVCNTHGGTHSVSLEFEPQRSRVGLQIDQQTAWGQPAVQVAQGVADALGSESSKRTREDRGVERSRGQRQRRNVGGNKRDAMVVTVRYCLLCALDRLCIGVDADHRRGFLGHAERSAPVATPDVDNSRAGEIYQLLNYQNFSSCRIDDSRHSITVGSSRTAAQPGIAAMAWAHPRPDRPGLERPRSSANGGAAAGLEVLLGLLDLGADLPAVVSATFHTIWRRPGASTAIALSGILAV